MWSEGSGRLIIISAPSGSGKTSLAGRVLGGVPDLRFSISHTTRSPRGGEQDGVEYFFVSTREFEAMIEAQAFLEWAHVYGHYYGTSREFVGRQLRNGNDVLLDIDVQGAAKVKKLVPEAITVFVLPPSLDELEVRLRKRGLDDDEVIRKRLDIARQEIVYFKDYDYLIVNDDIETSADELKSIILVARCRTERRKGRAQEIVDTFF